MNKKSKIASWAIALLLGVFGFSATATATVAPVINTEVISVTSKASASSTTEVKISANVTQVTYVKIPRSKVNMTACFWASGTWTNTGRRNGKIFRYRETSRAKFCPLKRPIKVGGVTYRHIKVAGGKTGSPCDNLAIPPVLPQPEPQLWGRVVDVVSITYNVTFKVTANATARATATCPDGSASASATGTGNALAYVVIKVKAMTKAQATARASLSIAQRIAVEGKAKASASASASAKATVTCGGNPPPPPPPAKSIKIVAMTTLNDIPTGKTSGPFYIDVNASDAGGSLTVDPGIGSVSKCDSTSPLGSVSFNSLPAGGSTQCVIFYAPSDPAKPSTMTVTATAILGSASDVKSHTFGISYPVRS